MWRPFVYCASVLYAALALVEIWPGLPLPLWLIAVNGVLWGVLVADYIWRLVFLAWDRRRYWYSPLCLLDLVVLASFPVLLAFGTGVLGLACIGRVVLPLVALRGSVRSVLRWLVPVALVVIVFLVAFYVWRGESLHSDSGIQSFGDALWWTVATILQVDYGDTYPHTIGGQVPAVVLTLLGVALFSWVTAILASWFVTEDEDGADAGDLERAATMRESERLGLLLAVEKLVVLRDAGLMSDAEFASEKARLIGSVALRDVERLAGLRAAGHLTDDEYATLKARIISSAPRSQPRDR